ncbi:hypothetical protein V6Z11_D12G171200 [Gossypium hirsutum]
MSLSFSSALLVQSFPRHDTVKLEEENFVQWQQHVLLIIDGYELQGSLEGVLFAPPRLVASPEASGLAVSEAEKRLVDVLMDFESRQMRVTCEVPMHAHLVETPMVVAVVDSVSRDVHGGRATVGSQGRGFRSQMQCQICNKFGHVAQCCFYRFNCSYDGLNASTRTRFSSSTHNRQGLQGSGSLDSSGSGGDFLGG